METITRRAFIERLAVGAGAAVAAPALTGGTDQTYSDWVIGGSDRAIEGSFESTMLPAYNVGDKIRILQTGFDGETMIDGVFEVTEIGTSASGEYITYLEIEEDYDFDSVELPEKNTKPPIKAAEPWRGPHGNQKARNRSINQRYKQYSRGR